VCLFYNVHIYPYSVSGWGLARCGGHCNPYSVSGDPCVNNWGPMNNFLHAHSLQVFFCIPEIGTECCL